MDEFSLPPAVGEAAPAARAIDVIVVGAGVSGLRAAGHLQAKYGLRVVVLEAQDRIGGCVGRGAALPALPAARAALPPPPGSQAQCPVGVPLKPQPLTSPSPPPPLPHTTHPLPPSPLLQPRAAGPHLPPRAPH